MKQYKSLTFPALFSETVEEFGTCNAMALVGQTPFTYNEVNSHIQSLSVFFEKLGIKPGDKIALLSTNMPNWGMAYYATTFMGAVVVPITVLLSLEIFPAASLALIVKLYEVPEAKPVT